MINIFKTTDHEIPIGLLVPGTPIDVRLSMIKKSDHNNLCRLPHTKSVYHNIKITLLLFAMVLFSIYIKPVGSVVKVERMFLNSF